MEAGIGFICAPSLRFFRRQAKRLASTRGTLRLRAARFVSLYSDVSLRQECVPKIIIIIATHSGSRSGISPFRRASA